jgi:tetratricopeptide (TPR) repeat protein
MPVPPSAGEALRSRPRAAPALAAGALALVVGLAFGRFVTYDGGSAASDASPAARATVTRAATSNDLADTIASLEARVVRDPADAAAWQALGFAHLRRAAQGDPSSYDLSGRAFARAGQLAPGAPATLVGTGALAVARHEFARAAEIGRRARAADPADPEALVVSIDAAVELGHYDDAATHLDTLLSLRPGVAAHARVSYLRELHGDVDGAITAMRQARVAAADDAVEAADVSVLLGDLQLAHRDARDALADYERARRAVPNHTGAELGRSRALLALGRDDDAVAALRTLVERVPLPAAAELLGDIESSRGDAAEARDAYELVRATATLQESSGVVVDLELARFEADHGDAATASRLARAAYRERPANVFTADTLAWARSRAGDLAGARAIVDRALRLGTRDAALRVHAAIVLDAVGETARARAELRAAFTVQPWFAYGLRDDATALAARLGVPVPEAWAP